MTFLSFLLYPFAILFDAVTRARNRLYDLSLKPSATFDVPVIGVGNLSVGGTGKTPMIEHLVRLLSRSRKVATLSRGYKRRTKGFRYASEGETAETIGDEPFQFYNKFRYQAIVAVGEERAMAIPNILQDHPDTDVILLDDAFQHRRVTPAFQILLTDFNAPFYRDYLLPAGRLRESRKGAVRADVIVVTKCPSHVDEEEMIRIQDKILTYTVKPVFFTTIHYGNPVSLRDPALVPAQDRVVLVSGIARTAHLEDYVRQNFRLAKHFRFPDHHHYSDSDLAEIFANARKENAFVLTTEKDAVKIDSEVSRARHSFDAIFYLPIEIDFLKNGKDFDEMVLNAVDHA